MGIFNAIAQAASLAYQVVKDQHLTGAQREANEFTASQTQSQMDFQEKMANTQYQRGVADMQAAGLNPALAYSQGGNVAPSGASGASVDPGRGMSMSDMVQLLSLPALLKKSNAETEEIESRSDLNRSSAELNRSSSELKQAELRVFEPRTELEMKNLESDLKSKEVERELKRSGISLNEAETTLRTNEAILSGIDAKYRDELNALENKVRIASIGLTSVQSKETMKRIEVYDAEINELLQRAITEAAQANLFDEQARTQLIEQGILQYDEQAKAYQVSKQKLTYTLDSIGKVFGAVSSAATTFGAVGVGTRAFSGINSFNNQLNLKGSGLIYSPANSFNPYAIK